MIKNNRIFLGIIDNSKDFNSIFNEVNSKENILFLQENICSLENIITITEKEIKQCFNNYRDLEMLREESYSYYKKNIQGKNIDIGDYRNIRISRKSAERYKHYGADERKMFIVIKLLDILKTARYNNSSEKYKDRNDKIIKFHYFTNKVIVKNEEYDVFITIGEDNKGKLFYDLDENKDLKK